MFLVTEIIRKKRDKLELTTEEIQYIIKNYTKGDIPDYQMSALLMAIFINGMNPRETADLTKAMKYSGEIVDLSSIPGIKVDKHSSGGVGDKVSLILTPLVASCGVPVPMISGRGLGHTGGTLDKLESIPGFNVNLALDEFIRLTKSIGAAMIGQTKDLAPADKKIYALRDVTATVPCLPLIVGSIMSKKLAAGPDAFVFDVKTGKAAFMQTFGQSAELAKALVSTAVHDGKKAVAYITAMNQPLGKSVGHALEVEETIRALKGENFPDLMEVTIALSAHMLVFGGKAQNMQEAKSILIEKIQNGEALQKFREIIKAQNGDPNVIDDYSKLPQANHKIAIKSDKNGWIEDVDAMEIAMACLKMGAGRQKVTDKIDPAVGVIGEKKIGDKISKNETLAIVHINKENPEILDAVKSAFKISENEIKPEKTILAFVDQNSQLILH